MWQSGHRPALLVSLGLRDLTEYGRYYGVLGVLSVALLARNCPHRVAPCSRHPAQRVASNPAIRPHRWPE